MLNHETESEQVNEQGPLSQRYTEPSVQAVITANVPMSQENWDEDFSNVTSVQHGINSLSFNTLAANIHLQSLTSRNQPDRLQNPVMDWIVPDGQNKKLRDHRNKSMSEGMSPDGGPTIYRNLSNLGPYFSSSNFLIDMVTGCVFMLHKRRWVRTGLTCTQNQTPPEELGTRIQEASNTYWNRLIANNETSLQRISNKDIRRNTLNKTTQVPVPQPVLMAQLPPLPRIDNQELYTIHDKLMPLRIRRTYIKDRTRNAHTYIMEYSATLKMIKERRYVVDKLWDRLRIVYGRVDAVRQKIDESLATDDRLCRQCGKMEFRSLYRFPDPTEMENSMPPTRIQWISREANELGNEITQMIDQEPNETLSEFRPITEDVNWKEKINQT